MSELESFENFMQDLIDTAELGAVAATSGDVSPYRALESLGNETWWTPAHTFYFKLGFYMQTEALKDEKATAS